MPLLTVELPPGSVLADALNALGLTEDEIDRDFGMVAVDPDAGRFALRVGAETAARLGDSSARVFADPPIESLGTDEPPD
ncbi:hypothetical protein [Nocardia carnea]|uniref:hypothetical protein n=1 Tax=Nocardia carnea TaxID=37328 RepID=UPI00245656D8|nr:hypothetical protein [Nocardia carnea]